LIDVVGLDGIRRGLKVRRAIIASGTASAPAYLTGDTGLSIDTDQLLEVSAAPPSILLIGGGATALTFATIFSSLGSKATVIEESDRVLPEIDQEITDLLQRELKKNKIQVLTSAKPLRFFEGSGGEAELEVEVKGEKTKLKAACIVRTARLPNIEGLGVLEIGVALNDHGGIMTDAAMETSVTSIFAAGDVTMNHLSTPVAYAEGLVAAANIAGKKATINYSAIPCWSNTIPAVCGAGLTEAEAKAKGYAIRIGRFPMAANGMATVLGRRTGMVKMVIDEKYGQILGVHVMGHNAPELVHEVLLAMRSELTPLDIADVFHVHPSLSEAFWDAANAADGASINSFSPGA
jgi:dihydrolipoamide dehydrogenase